MEMDNLAVRNFRESLIYRLKVQKTCTKLLRDGLTKAAPLSPNSVDKCSQELINLSLQLRASYSKERALVFQLADLEATSLREEARRLDREAQGEDRPNSVRTIARGTLSAWRATRWIAIDVVKRAEADQQLARLRSQLNTEK